MREKARARECVYGICMCMCKYTRATHATKRRNRKTSRGTAAAHHTHCPSPAWPTHLKSFSKVSSLCDTVNRVVRDSSELVPIHSTAQRSRLDIRGLAQVARRGNGGLKVWPRCGTVSPRQLAPGMCPQECIRKTPLCI